LVWYYKTRKAQKDNAPDVVLLGDKKFVVHAGVRPPTINSLYMMDYLKINVGEEVLDIGTGCGVHAIFAAEKAKRVVATDIFEPAVENAKVNARLHHVDKTIDFRVGDLLEPIHEGEKFDVIFFNINYPFEKGDSKRQRLHERFFSQIRTYMKPNARIYYQTSFARNIPTIYDILTRHQFSIMEVHMKNMTTYQHEPIFIMAQSR
jgi:16S rRNA G1207 methylase RsmC